MLSCLAAAVLLLAMQYEAEDIDPPRLTHSYRLDATRQLIEAIRQRDRNAFSRWVAPGARADRKHLFTLKTLARFADRCEASLGRPWNGKTETISHWVCPGGGPAMNTLFVYDGERVVAVSTQPTPRVTVPIPCGGDSGIPCTRGK